MTTTQALPGIERDFFTIGGTLSANAPSYVERKADAELFARLSNGDFCYVLTSRQMGKSSLMVRTATRLRRSGTSVAVLDLTKVGQNLTPEQWYDGLLIRLGQEFDLEDEIENFWNSFDEDIRRMGPMQRWMSAIREVILKSMDGNLVIFVDEIDAVRGLPFSSDEFFAGIRELYNARTGDPELNRITFCLLGVATPSDLIRNVNTTPFNIGYRIALTDFSKEEAEPLIQGLGRNPEIGRKLLHRVLWWTAGHPYLTQRMCAAIASNPDIVSDSGVNRICTELFLSSRARETDDNLLFVRERVLRSDADRADLLDLYQRIHARKNVPDDDANRIIDVLRLAGLVAVRDNRLVVRNNIYGHVFDERWIRVHMPDAELRRQRAAFRRGMIMAVGLAALVLGAIGSLIFDIGWRQHANASQEYSANMVQAQQDFDNGDFFDGTALLRLWLPPQKVKAYQIIEPSHLEEKIDDVSRGFEWGYLLGRSDGDSILTYTGHKDEVHIAISPGNGCLLATGGGSLDSTVRLFDICNVDFEHGTPRLLRALVVLDNEGNDQSYMVLPASSDPKWSIDTTLHDRGIWTNKEDHPLAGVESLQFSPDGRWLGIATGTWRSTKRGTVYLWSMQLANRVIHVHTAHGRAVNTIAFQNNAQFATASNDGTSEFWRIEPDSTVRSDDSMLSNPLISKTQDGVVQFNPASNGGASMNGMNASAYSPDGRVYAMIFGDGHLWIGGNSKPLMADISGLMSMAFYDDDHLLLGSRDGRIRCFDVHDKQHPKQLWVEDSEQSLVTSLTISSDTKLHYDHSECEAGCRLLVTTGNSGTIRLWDLKKNAEHMDPHGDPLRGHRKEVLSAAMTPDQNLIVSGGTDYDVRFWMRKDSLDGGFSYAAQQPAFPFRGAVKSLAFRPDDNALIASVRGISSEVEDNTPTEVSFNDLRTGNQMSLQAHKAAGAAVAWSPDGKFVATTANLGTVLLWDAKVFLNWDATTRDTTTPVRIPTDPQSKPRSFQILQDKDGHAIPITTLSFLANGYLVGAGVAGNSFYDLEKQKHGKGGAIFLWKWNTPGSSEIPLQRVVSPPQAATMRALATSPENGGYLALCGADNRIRVWKTDFVINRSLTENNVSAKLDGADVARLDPITASALTFVYPCSAIAFSADGQWLAAGTTFREIRVWRTSNWKLADATDSAAAAINTIAFSPNHNSRLLAIGTADSKILLWDFKSRWDANSLDDFNAHRSFPTIASHSGGVLALAFSPGDGRCIASGSNDQTMRITCALNPKQITDTICRLRSRQIGSMWKWSRLQSESDNWIHFPLLDPVSTTEDSGMTAGCSELREMENNK